MISPDRSSSAQRVAVITTFVSSWKRDEMEPSHSSRCLRFVAGDPASSMFLMTSSMMIQCPGLPVIPPPMPTDSMPAEPAGGPPVVRRGLRFGEPDPEQLLPELLDQVADPQPPAGGVLVAVGDQDALFVRAHPDQPERQPHPGVGGLAFLRADVDHLHLAAGPGEHFHDLLLDVAQPRVHLVLASHHPPAEMLADCAREARSARTVPPRSVQVSSASSTISASMIGDASCNSAIDPPAARCACTASFTEATMDTSTLPDWTTS